MKTIASRKHWGRRSISLVLLLAVVISVLSPVQSVMAAPLLQTGIRPITDPKQCTSVNQGGISINFEDLPTATHVEHQYAPLGVHFVDSRSTTPLIYSNTAERQTNSNPNSLTNDADFPNTSAGIALAMWFDAAQTTVGFYMGNGSPAAPPTATLRAYSDVAGAFLIGSVGITVPNNDVKLFYGVTSVTGAAIRRVELDYGQTSLSEEIDDLCFSKSQDTPPTHTFTGHVFQSGRLDTPTALPGVQVSLYGSNVSSVLGALLITDTSASGTGFYSLTTTAAYLYYTLVEGSTPQNYCRLKAVPGTGGVALDKERIQYAHPMPGTHPRNDFYNASGKLCLPPPVITPTASLIPFNVVFQQFPPVITNVDLQATRIEVNQAIQDNSNSVEQVVAKKTVVRVYVASGSSSTINNVLVRLHVFLNGTEAAVADARTQAVPSPQRTNKDDSANFYLYALAGSNVTIGFYAEVDPTHEVSETNESNNRFPAAGNQNHTFYKRQGFTIAYAPIHYTYSGWGGASDPTSRIDTAVDWLRSIYPVPNYYARSSVYYPYPGFTFSKNVNVYDYELIEKLNYRWFLSHWGFGWMGWLLGVDVGPASNQLYGWLPDGAYGGNGLSNPTWDGGLSHVSFGNDKPDKYRRTLAHEIGHNFGLCHNNRFIDTIGFDVFLSKTVKGTSFRDFMWPARREDEAWIDTINYGRLFGWLAPGATIPPGVSSCLTLNMASVDEAYTWELAAPLVPTSDITGVREFAFVAGSVNISGTGTLEPVYRDTRNAGDMPQPVASQYCVAMLNAGNEVIDQHCFMPDFSEPGDGLNPRTQVGFGFPMLWNPSTTRIELRDGATVLDFQNVSANTPVVTVTTPNGGENYAANANITINWTATDADGDPLTYGVFYSPDGGASWVPAADGLTTTTYVLSSTLVAGSNQAYVKIMASDGANTGQDQSNAAFTVSRKPPQIYITEPVNGGFIQANTAVALEGWGLDLEDGNLEGADLQWVSNRDGALGSGASLLKPSLSNGWHTITLTGTDSDGGVGVATIQVLVGERVYLPLVLR